MLRRAHLVNEHREGRHRFYHLNPGPLKAVDSWLEQYRTFWNTSLANLKAFVEAEYAKENRGPRRRIDNVEEAVKRAREKRKSVKG